jgi:hypothetical protein
MAIEERQRRRSYFVVDRAQVTLSGLPAGLEKRRPGVLCKPEEGWSVEMEDCTDEAGCYLVLIDAANTHRTSLVYTYGGAHLPDIPADEALRRMQQDWMRLLSAPEVKLETLQWAVLVTDDNGGDGQGCAYPLSGRCSGRSGCRPRTAGLKPSRGVDLSNPIG